MLHGDGNLWWTGAIVKGMKYAYDQGSDYFIWLNDDTLPTPGTLNLMVKHCMVNPHEVVTAQCYADPTLTQPNYGGRRVKGFSLQFLAAEPEEILNCDVCSGNLVSLHRSVIDAIGYPPSCQTPQTWADVVYTWTAKEAGFEIIVLGSAVAICPNNLLEEGWSSSRIPMLRRWQLLGSPKTSVYPPAYWFYCQKIYGVWGVIPFVQVYLKLVLFTVLRLILPLNWITKLKS
jgi:GT2 family glycosyltransferase